MFRLIDKRKNLIPFQIRELLAEELHIAFVNGFWAGHDVGQRPEHEYPAGNWRGEDGKTNPLNDFAEIVGRADALEKKSVRNVIIAVVFIFSQGADNPVGVHVNGHTGEENDGADDELRGVEPTEFIVVGGWKIEEPTALHEGVAGVEKDADGDDGNRHFAAAAHQRGKDERTLKIVHLEKYKDEKSDPVERLKTEMQRTNVERGHRQKYGRLHDEPA